MTDFDNIDMDALLLEYTQFKNQFSEKNQKAEELRLQIAEITQQWQTLSRERTLLENESKAEKLKLNELEKKIAQAQRLESVKKEQEELSREFEKRAAELDQLTATAKWREFAFDHQIDGGKRLAIAKRGILADKRGLGKTLTSLVWADMVQGKRILVIAPNDVVPQFEQEIRNWTPTRTCFSLRGLNKGQRDLVYPMLNMLPEFIVTINYEAWRRDKSIIDDLVEAGLDTIICDEAHRIKSADKVTARGVFQIAYRPNYCASCDKVANYCGAWEKKVSKRIGDSDRTYVSTKLIDQYANDLFACESCGGQLTSTVANVLCMTGTPILNKPQELFSLLHMVDANRFKTESKFLQDYCYSYAPNRWRFVHGGLERLTKFMSNFFLQRNRDDAGIHVPPPAITIHEIEKDLVAYAKQYEVERRLQEAATLMMEDGTRKDIFFILEMILRERQAMTWPAGINIQIKDEFGVVVNTVKFDVRESQKLDAAMDLLNELVEEEERVVVFSQFKDPLYEMKARLEKAGVSVAMATGDQNDSHKQAVREDFDLKSAPEKPRFQICLATYKAFGTGINLNAARHMILLDDEWNPGMEDQAIGRIDRMNSVDQANVHIFRVKKSVDDFMAKLLEEKRKIVEGFSEASIEAELRGYFQS